jgi:hypothetical protein
LPAATVARNYLRDDTGHGQPDKKSQYGSAEGRNGNVSRDFILALAKMEATVFQARVITHRTLAPVRSIVSLAYRRVAKGFRIGFFVACAQRSNQCIKQREDFN